MWIGSAHLERGENFVIAGDQNSDPLDGDSIDGSIQQLLDHPLVNTEITPSSAGGPYWAGVQDALNDSHLSDPLYDTADFCDTAVAPPCRTALLTASRTTATACDPTESGTSASMRRNAARPSSCDHRVRPRRMAFWIALAFDRPWPMKQPPLTPRSGAAPNSE